MPTREDNSWRVYGLHVLSLPIRLAVAIVLIAAVLPFSIVNLLLIMPLKCLLNASKCTANRDNSFGTEASHNAASENHASPSCYPSACTWSPLVFSKEQENRAKIHGCKHLLQLICCTVVVGNRPYTACPVCCSPKRTFSPALMYHV
ncbi:hypothetical protein Pelo_11126 [Pelomyxa schiedti]|nr:hypothetical protein Pelo_11126 [Pelomyxa schiedti]